MMHRVERLAGKLTSILSSWDGVECIQSCDASDTDVLDPYFALVLDVYCTGPIPDSDARQAQFDNPGAFETSRSGEKDRFFLEGLPIRLEYKNTVHIAAMVDDSCGAMLAHGGIGSYVAYRLLQGTVLFSRTDWIDRMRRELGHIPEEFWERLLEMSRQKMEHSLSDLGGAALKDDRFFYHVSLAAFMRATASTLFAHNRQWEPSERHMTDALMALSDLPEDFAGRWATLVRTDGAVDPSRRYQVAQLIARSVLASD